MKAGLMFQVPTPGQRGILGNCLLAMNPSAGEDTPPGALDAIIPACHGRGVSDAERPRQGPPAISRSVRTVRQLRTVLVVESFESKYWFVSLVRPIPFGQWK